MTLVGFSKGGLSGVGMLSLPMMTMVTTPLQAAAIMLPILLVQDAVSVWSFRRTWDRGNMAILLPGAVAGVLAGYVFAAWVSDAAVAVLVGLIGVGFGLQRLIGELRGTTIEPQRGGIVFGVICGAGSGFTSMIAHAGGPPFAVYMLPQRLDRDLFLGTSVIFFALVNLMKLPPYIALGQFTRETLVIGVTMVPVAVGSTMLGVQIARRLSGPVFYRLVYSLLVLVGSKLAWDGTQRLLGLS